MQRLGYQVIVINIDNNNINTSWILLVIIIFNMKIILSRIPFQHANQYYETCANLSVLRADCSAISAT